MRKDPQFWHDDEAAEAAYYTAIKHGAIDEEYRDDQGGVSKSLQLTRAKPLPNFLFAKSQQSVKVGSLRGRGGSKAGNFSGGNRRANLYRVNSRSD